MANVIEIAKAAIIAYNEKDWSKAKDILAADAVYDEKELTAASRAPARSSRPGRAGPRPSPTSKPHSCASSRAGTPRSSSCCGKAFTRAHYRHQQVPFRPSNKPIEMPACQVVRVEGDKVKSASHYFDMLTMLTQIGATGAVKTAA